MNTNQETARLLIRPFPTMTCCGRVNSATVAIWNMSGWTLASSTATATRRVRRVSQKGPPGYFDRDQCVQPWPEAATLDVLPTLWFRNTWTWWPGAPKPLLKKLPVKNGNIIATTRSELGDRFLYCEGAVPLLFTENETNNERIFGTPNASRYVKDAINNYVVSGKLDPVNPQHTGTKGSAHYRVTVDVGKAESVRLRLNNQAPAVRGEPFGTQFTLSAPMCHHSH
jgi:hypothetical protein